MTEPKEQFKEREWVCTVCDYIYVGEQPPEKCPKCNAPKDMFVESKEVEEETRNEK